jgi:hypothetical protein
LLPSSWVLQAAKQVVLRKEEQNIRFTLNITGLIDGAIYCFGAALI